MLNELLMIPSLIRLEFNFFFVFWMLKEYFYNFFPIFTLIMLFWITKSLLIKYFVFNFEFVFFY